MLPLFLTCSRFACCSLRLCPSLILDNLSFASQGNYSIMRRKYNPVLLACLLACWKYIACLLVSFNKISPSHLRFYREPAFLDLSKHPLKYCQIVSSNPFVERAIKCILLLSLPNLFSPQSTHFPLFLHFQNFYQNLSFALSLETQFNLAAIFQSIIAIPFQSIGKQKSGSSIPSILLTKCI